MKLDPERSLVTYSDVGGVTAQVIEDYRLDPEGNLLGLHFEQKQINESGTIEIVSDQLYFRYQRPGKTEVVEHERLEKPLVAPGTLSRFIDLSWDRLMAGEKFSVRMALIERQETVGIEIKRSNSDEPNDAVRVLKIKPSSFVISLLFPSIFVKLDARSHRLVSFTGPSPYSVKKEGKWEGIKAEVRVLP